MDDGPRDATRLQSTWSETEDSPQSTISPLEPSNSNGQHEKLQQGSAIGQDAENDSLLKVPSSLNSHSLARRGRNFWRHLFADTWFPEFISWVFSFACFAAIVVVLRLYNAQPLPQFRYGITIGALVALFTTLSTTALMFPISHSISQLKWLWFTGVNKRAADLEKFDRASRGAGGSLALLFSTRPNVASIGALVTILVLAANTITQQSISYRSERVIGGNDTATSPRSDFFDSYEPPTTFSGYTKPPMTDQQTEAAVLDGILHGDSPALPIQPHCSTGNCTWDPYLSLGVCSSFTDLSHQLVKTPRFTSGRFDGAWIVNLPGALEFIASIQLNLVMMRSTGKYIFGSLRSPLANFTGKDVPSKAFGHLENTTVSDFYLIYTTPDFINHKSEYPELKVWAFEVNLHFCVHNLSSTVHDGVALTEVSISPTFQFEYPKDVLFNDYYDQDVTSRDGIMTATSPDSTEQFRMTRTAQQALLFYTRAQFIGMYETVPESAGVVTTRLPEGGALMPIVKKLLRSSARRSSRIHQNWGNGYYPYPPNFESVIGSFARNLATILSNRIRLGNNVKNLPPPERLHHTPPAVGRAFHIVTHVQVTWGWIIFLAALEAGSFFFLVTVVFLSSKGNNKLWRGSNLALLQALHQSLRPRGMTGMQSNVLMEEYAEKATLRLSEVDGIWRLTT